MHVGHLLTRAARRYPDRSAWLLEDRAVSFREAEDRTNRLANALHSRGCQPGDRVGMLLSNCHQGLETILAPIKAGMATVPMNIRLHPREHEYLLSNSGASVLVYGQEFRDHVAEIRESLDGVKHFVCVGDGSGGDLAYEVLIEEASPRDPDPAIDPDDLAWMFYTSGTTGRPKGAMISHRNLLAMVDGFLLDINPVSPDDVLLHAGPVTHGSGLSIFHHIVRGAASAFPLSASFDPPKVFEAIQRYRVTTMFLAPTMVNVLVNSPDKSSYDLSSLHTVFYGGGPMHVEHILQAVGAFGNIFVQIFGQGEAPMTVTSLPREEHLVDGDPVKLGRMASAGKETTDVRVRIVDEQDREVPSGEMGEIVVSGDLVMKGYWNNPEASAETLRGGWLHTGDLGYMDAEGYLFITDRTKDMIISGGANIYPREVDEVIAQHPAVAEVAVIGVPDELWGESVKAAVVLRSGESATEDEIIEFCRQRLASYKKPRYVEFLPDLPKNAYGKVLKRELRDKHWAGQERKV